jgi:hypothetical protein
MATQKPVRANQIDGVLEAILTATQVELTSIMLVALLLLASALPAQASDAGDWIPVILFGPEANKLVEECRHYGI